MVLSQKTNVEIQAIKPRIGIFLESLGYGGVARVYMELIPFLEKEFEIDLIVFDGSMTSIGCDESYLRKKWVIWPQGGFRWFYPHKVIRSMLRYRKIAKNGKYELMLSAGYFANFLCSSLAPKYSYKAVLSQHADFKEEIFSKRSRYTAIVFKALLKMYFKKADAIIAVSRGVRDVVKNDLGISSDKCHIIHNPINIEKVRQETTEPIQQNEKEWFLGNDFHFISAGRFTSAKNYPLLLEAFFKVVGKKPNCKLTILGDGEKRPVLEKMVDELRIREKVWLPGFRNNPFKYFTMANCFVSSSGWEGFGNVIVEAMACGLPIIATRSSGAIDILLGGEKETCGVLVPLKDVNALSYEMLFMVHNIRHRKRYKHLSMARHAAFDVQNVASNYSRLINDILGMRCIGQPRVGSPTKTGEFHRIAIANGLKAAPNVLFRPPKS